MNKRKVRTPIYAVLPLALLVACAADVDVAAAVNQTKVMEEAVEVTPVTIPEARIVPKAVQIPVVKPTVTVNEYDAKLIARTLWGECRGVKSKAEQAAVAWCILNRVDAEGYACGTSVEYVVTFPDQFAGYDASYPVTDELYDLAVDVLTRWQLEKAGASDVGRVLPKEYLWFTGDGQRNHFTDEWKGGNRWDWSLPSPYTTNTEGDI